VESSENTGLEGSLGEDGGGQRTEVGGPYDAKGGVQRGVEKDLQRDKPSPDDKPA
jgi:hypothetical protein